MSSNPADLSVVAASQRLAAGELSSVELVRACLDRIAEREGVLQAWAHLDPELALAQATARDAEPRRGPLHGIPVGVKDVMDTGDMPTSYGSPIYDGHQPAVDAAMVRWLRDAGAVILGKTVTTEFGVFHPGPTTNPHDPSRTPGGSSSGSAAAVAAGMVPLATAAQTAASIVRPAGYCGVAGFKPTFGTFPVAGVHAIAPSLDTLGLFAREVEDLALAGGIHLPHEDEPPVPIAWAPTALAEHVDPEALATIEAFALDAHLPTVRLPAVFDDLARQQVDVMAFEAFASLSIERDRGPVSTELERLLEQGSRIPAEQHAAALAVGTRCRLELATWMAEVGVGALLTPSVADEAPVGLASTGNPLFGRPWSLLGVPSVAVPGLLGPAGMPLGVQVVAPYGADRTALTAARQLSRLMR